MRTDNLANTVLAKFESIYDESYAQFSNGNNFIYLTGLYKNCYKIYNPVYGNDEGLCYNNNLLSVRAINNQIIKYNNYTTFPNEFTILDKYELTESSKISQFECSSSFDMNSSTYWLSANIYSPNDGYSTQSEPISYKFQDSWGHWIKIKFPYSIIPVGFYVSSLNNVGDPLFFDVYLSNDNITWTKILVVNSVVIGNDFFFTTNTNFYLYVAIVVTRINVNPQIQSLQSFKIRDLRIYAQPILHVDDNIKISKNNIYNVTSINTKQLLLNNVPISGLADLNNIMIAQTIDALKNKYNIYWSNLNGIGYNDTTVVSKISINSNIANSVFDINGDISFKQQSLNNRIFVSNKITNLASSYVYVGKITYNNTTKNYFKLSLFLFELEKYYFQTINIYGYTLLSINTGIFQNVFNAYWDTTFENSYGIQRVVDIVYVIDTILATKTTIKFYIKYNDLLNVTLTQSINIAPEYINQVIYSDFINTSSITDIEFFPRTVNENIGEGTVFFKAILINSMVLNNSGSAFSYLSVSNLVLNNASFGTCNLLMLDKNRNIIDSGISCNVIAGLSGSNPNKLVATDNKGFISYLNVSSALLSNIDVISKTNGKIMISSNSLFEDFTVNKNNLSNLNIINTIPNSVVIINGNNELKTTTTVRVDNISNVLGLFNFEKDLASATSNIKINNLYIGNHIINSNYKYNRILVNNREIADDIFKLIVKIPDFNDTILTSINIINSIYTNTRKYVITFNSGYTITVEIDANDDNTDILKKVYRIFDKNSLTFWQSEGNFLDYQSTTRKYGSIKKLYDDVGGATACGSYIIIDLGIQFVLNFYSIYVNYANIASSIRDFKLFGYTGTGWVLIDERVGVIMNNNLIPNVYRINKKKFEVYSKYAFCIINTHNTNNSIPTSVTINGIEFYGVTINTNFYNNSNTITYNNEINMMTLLGFNNVGISNINPVSALSIGNDLFTNASNSLLSLNHPTPTSFSNMEVPIINITRPSSNLITTGVKAIHYLNSWYTSNTTYSIKLTHSNINNEKVVLAMNSDGKIAVGGYPDSNHTNNGISIFNNGISFYQNSNFINFQTSNILSNYNIVLPPTPGIYDTTFYINNVSNNTVYLTFDDPYEKLIRRPHIKFGNQNIIARKENGVVIQIAGNCLIGSNDVATVGATYLKHALCVAGTIYSTVDITTDSDISYKYNIKIIEDPLMKINKINGYTFNRNDTNDDNRYTGLIAQEVLKVMPEVITRKHDGKYRIIYTNLAGLFIEGIKKLDQKSNYINLKVNLMIATFGLGFIYLYRRGSL
jgi:hypothetical protein